MSDEEKKEFIKIEFGSNSALDFELVSFSQGRDGMFILIVKPVRFEEDDE